jgi:hypothetical protein
MIKKTVVLSILGLFFSTVIFAAEQPIGTVLASRGNVKVEAEGKHARSLSRGSSIFLKETIVTKDKSRVQIRLQDGTIITLQPDTRYQVEELNLDSKNNKNSRYVGRLVEGTLVNLSGSGTRSNHIVKTNVVTIAARGTYFQVKSQSKKLQDRKKQTRAPVICKGDLLMEAGETFVMDGELEVSSGSNRLCNIAAHDLENNKCAWEAIGCFDNRGEFLFNPSQVNTPTSDRSELKSGSIGRSTPETEISPKTEQNIYSEQQIREDNEQPPHGDW